MATDRISAHSSYRTPVLFGPTAPTGVGVPRLSLEPSLSHTGMFDGAWWPRSRRLELELPALVALLRRRVGPVLHVGVERSAWGAVPGRITVEGRVVRVNCFSSSVHTIGVGGGHQDHFLLLVVPPHTRPAVARAAMASAARRGNSTSAARLDGRAASTTCPSGVVAAMARKVGKCHIRSPIPRSGA